MAVKVLVVDDEPDIAMIFRQKFRRRIAASELEFSFATNGNMALSMLASDPEISLVFTDIRMPSMDGLTFLKELKALERQVLLPLVVSAYDDMPNIREAMRQGAWDFVTKPIDLEDLERVLNAAVAEISQKLEAIRFQDRLWAAENERLAALRTKEMQQQFFENITHELRTPLTLLLAPLQSAIGLCNEAQVVAYLRQAQKSGLILLDLVTQLLDFAKVDAQKMQPQWRNTSLSLLAADVAAIFEPLAQQKQIRFLQEIDPGITGRTDPRMCGRILVNLLSNAFKFTPSGGSITLLLSQENDLAVIEVQDTGMGISPTETEHLFQRFHQSGQSNAAAYSGTGLGLMLSKSLAELMAGSLELITSTASGSRFQFRLPLQPAQNGEPTESETLVPEWVSALGLSESETLLEDPDADRPLILVAEDHPDMRHYILQLLKGEFSVITAENGRIGLEKALDQVPDLIVTDWMMPEMDGLELLRRIRHDQGTQHIPVVMLTAKSEVEHRIAGTASGAEAFVGKPFHPDELVAVVHNLLKQRERLRERFRAEMLRPDKFHGASMEDQFLSELKKVMEKNLMNEQFGVETMADALAMSRRTLVRKLHAVTGQAPVKFIRGYRLERALQMLKDNTAPVWEIAVKTGFGSASYFTKCFKDHYGISPKEAVHMN